MKQLVILGIDPGKDGALSILDLNSGAILERLRMPESVEYMHAMLSSWDSKYHIEACGIEHAQAMRVGNRPQGGKAMFSYGYGFGTLIATLKIIGIPLILLHPRTWTSFMHHTADKTLDAKAKSLQVARAIWPEETFIFPKGRVAHDGLVDSALMAEYTRRNILCERKAS